jgi:hypothetical protein
MGTISHHHRSAAPEFDAGRHTPVSRWRRRPINSLRAAIALLAAACFAASDFKSRNVREPGNTLTGIWNAAPLTAAVSGALAAQDAVAADSHPPARNVLSPWGMRVCQRAAAGPSNPHQGNRGSRKAEKPMGIRL